MTKEDDRKTQQDRQEGPERAPHDIDRYVVNDVDQFTRNMARAIEAAGKAAGSWLRPREAEGNFSPDAPPEMVSEVVRTMMRVQEYWVSDPQRALDAQTRFMSAMMNVWADNMRRMSGESVENPRAKADRRFKDEDWAQQPFFAFTRDMYLALSDWAEGLVEDMGETDERTRHKAEFYMRHLLAAVSPTNFPATNPVIYRETASSNGENFVKGLQKLVEHIDAQGRLLVKQVDDTPFTIGENIAVTPGKVVARNELVEIIQYEPTTQTVLKRPLLITPPWINKFYILDLNEKKSFISWAVDQGHSVFVISWVNPDERHRDMGWKAYIERGVVFGLDTVEQITGESEINTIGYCVGGTLLTAGLSWLAARGDHRARSATLFATQVDFEYAGDLKVFVDEEQLAAIEAELNRTGYLSGDRMSNAFNLLRSKELIWPYVVDNYMRGRDPMAFDLLYWNADATRMTAANHSFYLRNCYLENNLSAGNLEFDGTPIDLSNLAIPIYNLATKDDHIAPAKSVHKGSRFFGGPVTLVISGSGHIAGVVNPPSSGKYQFWTNDEIDLERPFSEWLEGASETKGSWWPHWQEWIEAQNGERVDARPIGGGKIDEFLGDAPGSYVREKA